MEEAPNNGTQELARKFELLSEKTAEKRFPGLKAKFNDALDEVSRTGDEGAFWERVASVFREHGVDAHSLHDVLEER